MAATRPGAPLAAVAQARAPPTLCSPRQPKPARRRLQKHRRRPPDAPPPDPVSRRAAAARASSNRAPASRCAAAGPAPSAAARERLRPRLFFFWWDGEGTSTQGVIWSFCLYSLWIMFLKSIYLTPGQNHKIEKMRIKSQLDCWTGAKTPFSL